MSPLSRGFTGRRRPVADPSRVPPGQYVTGDFPVLSAGPTPHTPLDQWSFRIDGAVDEPVSWTWEELIALPAETITVDIHCVTKWSKLDTSWRGVSLDTLLESVDTEAEYLTAWSDGGYTTNLALEDATDGKAWSPTSTTASHSIPSTVARRGCSCRTCTSGRALSGSAA
jgi:DMSO/TMAO reductase YedYZ molybdopterin-dependent catalytic subunit